MNREELKSIFDALRNDPQHHLGLGDIRLTIAQQDAILDLFPFKDNPLPPAEGAEEIDDETIAWAAEHQCGTPFSERWIGFVKGAKWHRSLHSQRLAEKMVEERMEQYKAQFKDRPNPLEVNPYDSKGIKRIRNRKIH